MSKPSDQQRSIIFFLWKEGTKAADISRRLGVVFGDIALKETAVKKWVTRFKDGQETVEDDPRPGRPCTAVTRQSIEAVEKAVMADRRVTVREISNDVGISIGSAHEILSNELGMSKLSARWVPKALGAPQKQDRVDICRELLGIKEQYGEGFWRRIITTDESWLPFFNPETKEQSKQWRRPEEGAPVKFRSEWSTSKVMITVFWDCEGIIHIDYLPKGATINALYYSNLLTGPLRDALSRVRPGKLHARPLLQHDNARPHTARMTMAAIADLRWELLPHPAYSPDLAPSDYHLFSELKKPLRGHRYENLNQMKRAINEWILGTPGEFFERGLKHLVDRWNRCITMNGSYIEKFDQIDTDD
jgi:[histone H3]-lysine36 N-dimethyltransferase SETMAR